MNTNRSLPDLSIKKIWNKLFRHDNDIEVLQERPVNNNILINSNFANPVNQRGITPSTWERAQCGLDRWILGDIYGISVKSIDANGITISHGTDTGVIIGQKIELSEIDMSSKYTYSVYANGKVRIFTKDLSEFTVGVDKSLATGQDEDRFFLYVAYKPSLGWISFDICAYQENSSFTIKWAKLEKGEHATPYVPRHYAEEFQMCKRYFLRRELIMYVDNYVQDRISMLCQYPTEFRVTPTLTAKTYTLYRDSNTSITNASVDFATTMYYGMAHARFSSAHGLSPSNTVRLIGLFDMDAEL